MSKGFSYTLEDKKIIEYMKLSTESKLRWLYEINEFTNMALGAKEKEIRFQSPGELIADIESHLESVAWEEEQQRKQREARPRRNASRPRRRRRRRR